MFGLPIAFTSPLVLAALIALPVIWYLLRLTPPRPREEVFPPLVLLEKLVKREETPAKSPWWLTLLRLVMAALVIVAMAGPAWNPREPVLTGNGPVMLVIDDGWASGGGWEELKQRALLLTGEAAAAGRLMTLLRTTDPNAMGEELMKPEDVRAAIEARPNRALRPDHVASAAAIRRATDEGRAGEIVFLSDGLERNSAGLLSAIAGANPVIVTPELAGLAALGPVSNQPSHMTGRVILAEPGFEAPITVTGYDRDGLPIASDEIRFEKTDTSAQFRFDAPVELRNQITRVAIQKAGQAGGVQLLDDSNRRRIVGLISGQSADISQPLLSPLYYIERALAPFSDIRDADTANIGEAAGELIEQNVSAIIMADVGNLPEETSERIAEWIDKGGLLIRFAGPRLAATPDSELLPVTLLQGDRFIGGALSWETPKPVAPFEPGSPYYGLAAPGEVAVSRQVLAVRSRDFEDRIWARLDDGTPLVTADKRGNGWIVLFHVNSDNNWSNLPLSGAFVEMLRRTVNLSRSQVAETPDDSALRLPPLETLDGAGNLGPPPVEAGPLVIEPPVVPKVTLDNPPGFYGAEDGFVALNLIGGDEKLTPLDLTALPAGARHSSYGGGVSIDFKPILLGLAALLFLADCLAVLWFAGVLRMPARSGRAGPAAASLIMAAALALDPIPASAQDADINFSAALKTRFAYVETGVGEIDRISLAGLTGLSRFLTSRTALEPGEPVAIDIANDELAFYPFLYWPVHIDAPLPSDADMARVDAYMKQGGSILFDTRDQISGMLSGGSSAEALRLRQILASLDIPPLEPVPPDHVLTKAFYLLDSFPGRYQGGDLWVEQIAMAEEEDNRPARAGDGVSTILITGNDLAGAWAVDDDNRALFATVPPDPRQREYAFRVGVNIVMYTLTGNYKADQVHVPALLERLGQ